MKPRPVSLIIVYSLSHVLVLLSTWVEFFAVGGEGHLIGPFIFPMFISALRGTTDYSPQF